VTCVSRQHDELQIIDHIQWTRGPTGCAYSLGTDAELARANDGERRLAARVHSIRGRLQLGSVALADVQISGESQFVPVQVIAIPILRMFPRTAPA